MSVVLIEKHYGQGCPYYSNQTNVEDDCFSGFWAKGVKLVSLLLGNEKLYNIMAIKDKYINPYTDFGFKKLFGTEPNKDLLIDFLNEVILPEERKILDLSYTNPERTGWTKVDRKAIFDFYCVGKNNERFIVEMQMAKQDYFKDRSVYYASFPIQEQGRKGKWDFNLSEVYTVGVLDFVFSEDKDEQKVRHEVKLEDQDCQVFYDKLTFIYLEMPNFNKTEDELETTFDKWLYVLKYLPELENVLRNYKKKP